MYCTNIKLPRLLSHLSPQQPHKWLKQNEMFYAPKLHTRKVESDAPDTKYFPPGSNMTD